MIISGNSWVQANFVSKEFEVRSQISVIDQDGSLLSDQDAGFVSGTGLHEHGDRVELVFKPVEGYQFIKWVEPNSGETISYEPELEIQVKDHRLLEAVVRKMLSLELSSSNISWGNPLPNNGLISTKLKVFPFTTGETT